MKDNRFGLGHHEEESDFMWVVWPKTQLKQSMAVPQFAMLTMASSWPDMPLPIMAFVAFLNPYRKTPPFKIDFSPPFIRVLFLAARKVPKEPRPAAWPSAALAQTLFSARAGTRFAQTACPLFPKKTFALGCAATGGMSH